MQLAPRLAIWPGVALTTVVFGHQCAGRCAAGPAGPPFEGWQRTLQRDQASSRPSTAARRWRWAAVMIRFIVPGFLDGHDPIVAERWVLPLPWQGDRACHRPVAAQVRDVQDLAATAAGRSPWRTRRLPYRALVWRPGRLLRSGTLQPQFHPGVPPSRPASNRGSRATSCARPGPPRTSWAKSRPRRK